MMGTIPFLPSLFERKGEPAIGATYLGAEDAGGAALWVGGVY